MSEQRPVPITTTDTGIPVGRDEPLRRVGPRGPRLLRDASAVPERRPADLPDDDWSMRIDTWASTAQSAPNSSTP